MRTSKPGVYKITSIASGKFYIGSSAINVYQRWNDHKSQLKAGIHPNIHLQRSYTKNGLANFTFEVLEFCAEVLYREQHYIDLLQPQYNIQPNARNSFGIKRRPETCEKIGRSKLGNKNRVGIGFTDAVRKEISTTLKEGYKSGRIIHPLLGTTRTTAQNDANSKKKKGNNHRRNSPTYRDFVQMDKDTWVPIKLFETARNAIDSLGLNRHVNTSSLISACKKEQIAFGYRWKFLNVQVKSGELLEA